MFGETHSLSVLHHEFTNYSKSLNFTTLAPPKVAPDSACCFVNVWLWGYGKFG